MTTVDLLIVQTALPVIDRAFGVGPQLGQWLILAYAGTTVALQLPAGKWVDAVSPRPAFTLSVVVFGLASLACALAPSIAVLIAARVVQGAAAAVLGALIPGVAMASAPREGAGRAMGLVGMLGPLGAVSGPVIGGLLLSVTSWRAIFLVNIPIVAGIVIFGRRSIPARGSLAAPEASFLRESAIAMIAVGAFFAALTVVAQTKPRVLDSAVLAIVAVGAGFWWAREPGGRSMIRLFGTGSLGSILLAYFGVAIAGGALTYLSPFILSQFMHLPVAQWGPVLLALPFGMVASSVAAGIITDKWRPGLLALIGTVLSFGCALSLAVSVTGDGPALLGLRLFGVGVGMGCFMVPSQTIFMTQAPPEVHGAAGAAVNLLRQLAFAVGPAIATLVWLVADHGARSGLSASYTVPAVSVGIAVVVTGLLIARLSPAVAPRAPA